MRQGRSGHEEENARMRPFFQPGKNRHDERGGSEQLPYPENGQDIERITDFRHLLVPRLLYAAIRRPVNICNNKKIHHPNGSGFAFTQLQISSI